MNSSRTDLSKKEFEKVKINRKNIREIYLQAVSHNKGFKKSNKKKGISNLSLEERNGSIGSSNFLEKEYSLVQRIISDTKELKNIKTKTDIKTNDLTQINRQIAARYKLPEEYNDEILDLKKTLKILESNEVVYKAKMEYYEKELAKKEQEIIDLLDVKKAEEFRLLADSKSDLSALIYSLKQKVYKLEFSLKRKDYELNKLKNDLKTTNMKELKLQNERLRVELSKALMNDKKIIEVFEKNGVIDQNGSSFYESDKHKVDSEISLLKNEVLKKNIAKQLQSENLEEVNTASIKSKDSNTRSKIEQLEERETELLKEISRLNQDIRNMKLKYNSDNETERSSVKNYVNRPEKRNSRKELQNEKDQLNAIKSLQSVLRGHLHRSSSLNNKRENERNRSDSRSSSWVSPTPRSPNSHRSPRLHSRSRKRSSSSSNERYSRRSKGQNSSPIRQSPVRESPYHFKNNHYKNNKRNEFNSDESDDGENNRKKMNESRNNLIENKNVEEVSESGGGCCSSLRRSKKK